MLSNLAASGAVTEEEEETRIKAIFQGDTSALILAKHYSNNPIKFLKLLRMSEGSIPINDSNDKTAVDAVIVGAGIAGFSAALTLVDRGAYVVLVEKNKFAGGNSAYASSGDIIESSRAN